MTQTLPPPLILVDEESNDLETPFLLGATDIEVHRIQEHKQNKNEIYLRWAIAILVCSILLIQSNFLFRLKTGEWWFGEQLGFAIPTLSFHAICGLALIFLLLIVVITGALMGMASNSTDCESQEQTAFIAKTARRIHKVAGWVGACLFFFTSAHGAYLAFRYATSKNAPSSVGLVPIVGVGGIIICVFVVSSVFAVKVKKNYGLHKDLMMAALLYLFTGTGVIRWLDDITTALIPSDFVGGVVEASLSLLLVYPGLLVGVYWRAGRLENRSYAKKLLSSVILLPIAVNVGAYVALILLQQ
ncbi:MAG: hypothetical protein SGILL_010779 [Bacillariaceae sp.]